MGINLNSYFDDIKYFKAREFLRSETADTMGFEEQYDPPENVIVALHMLAENVLDPVRSEFGRAVIVTSGYRCERLNESVHGSAYSHHKKGMAADLTSADNKTLFELLKDKQFTQLIWYFKDNEVPEFIHVSYDPDDLRCDVLICDKSTGTRHYEKVEA